MKSYKRTDCRLCGSKNLDLVLKLTPTPPADSFIPKKQSMLLFSSGCEISCRVAKPAAWLYKWLQAA